MLECYAAPMSQLANGLACAAILLSASAVLAQDAGVAAWPTFRGPSSAGVAAATARPPVDFGPQKNLAWRVDVPRGHASPIVCGERIFIAGHTEQEVQLLCFDRDSGALRWRRAVAVETHEEVHRVNSRASSTPTTDGERVCAYFGSFGLLCYDMEGKELWRRRMAAPDNIFGSASSPTMVGSTLVFHSDQKAEGGRARSWLEAIDSTTGRTKWRVAREGFVSGWSTPVVWKNGNVDEVLVYGSFRLVAYDLRDGSERWSVPGLADEPCITPVIGAGLIFVTSYNMRTSTEAIGLPKWGELLAALDAEPHGNANGTIDREEAQRNESVLSRADADGEGDHPLRIFFRWLDADKNGELTSEEYGKLRDWLASFEHANALVAIRPGDGDERGAEIAWQYPRGVPECPSPLFLGGRVYLVKNGGMATCVDAASGRLVWQGRVGTRGPHYASPVTADGKIYVCSARGVVGVFRAGTDTLDVLANHDLEERIMATPAIVGDRLYVRTAEHLWCFGPKPSGGR